MARISRSRRSAGPGRGCNRAAAGPPDSGFYDSRFITAARARAAFSVTARIDARVARAIAGNPRRHVAADHVLGRPPGAGPWCSRAVRPSGRGAGIVDGVATMVGRVVVFVQENHTTDNYFR